MDPITRRRLRTIAALTVLVGLAYWATYQPVAALVVALLCGLLRGLYSLWRRHRQIQDDLERLQTIPAAGTPAEMTWTLPEGFAGPSRHARYPWWEVRAENPNRFWLCNTITGESMLLDPNSLFRALDDAAWHVDNCEYQKIGGIVPAAPSGAPIEPLPNLEPHVRSRTWD